MCMHVYACVCTCMHVYARVCTCMHVYARVCTCMHVYARVCTCVYVCMYVYMYICICRCIIHCYCSKLVQIGSNTLKFQAICLGCHSMLDALQLWAAAGERAVRFCLAILVVARSLGANVKQLRWPSKLNNWDRGTICGRFFPYPNKWKLTKIYGFSNMGLPKYGGFAPIYGKFQGESDDHGILKPKLLNHHNKGKAAFVCCPAAFVEVKQGLFGIHPTWMFLHHPHQFQQVMSI